MGNQGRKELTTVGMGSEQGRVGQEDFAYEGIQLQHNATV